MHDDRLVLNQAGASTRLLPSRCAVLLVPASSVSARATAAGEGRVTAAPAGAVEEGGRAGEVSWPLASAMLPLLRTVR